MKKPVGKRREKQKAETYALILESARFLFETRGFENTTIRVVASHAEIGLGTLYKHFTNKISLLAAALNDDLKRLFTESIKTLPIEATLKEQFLHVSGYYYRFYTSRQDLSRAYLSYLTFIDDAWMDKINEFETIYTDKITELVLAAQKRGEISAARDVRFFALSMISHYFFVLGKLFVNERIADPRQMLGFLEKLLDETMGETG